MRPLSFLALLVLCLGAVAEGSLRKAATLAGGKVLEPGNAAPSVAPSHNATASVSPKPAGCPKGCSGNGDCLKGVCYCYEGFGGKDCGQKQKECPHNCSGPSRGKCDLKTGQCTCKPEWAGTPDCSVPVCPAVSLPPAAATKPGEASASNTTASSPRLVVCGGHGRCNTTSKACECAAGWSGPACDQAQCPGSKIVTSFAADKKTVVKRTVPFPCSGHGVCSNSSSTASSDPNALPGDASAAPPPARCLCSPGYGGVDCSERVCESDCKTLGHGTCVQGECVCKPNWRGTNCELPVCPGLLQRKRVRGVDKVTPTSHEAAVNGSSSSSAVSPQAPVKGDVLAGLQQGRFREQQQEAVVDDRELDSEIDRLASELAASFLETGFSASASSLVDVDADAEAELVLEDELELDAEQEQEQEPLALLELSHEQAVALARSAIDTHHSSQHRHQRQQEEVEAKLDAIVRSIFFLEVDSEQQQQQQRQRQRQGGERKSDDSSLEALLRRIVDKAEGKADSDAEADADAEAEEGSEDEVAAAAEEEQQTSSSSSSSRRKVSQPRFARRQQQQQQAEQQRQAQAQAQAEAVKMEALLRARAVLEASFGSTIDAAALDNRTVKVYCSGHGNCLDSGLCSCGNGWSGNACEMPSCPTNAALFPKTATEDVDDGTGTGEKKAARPLPSCSGHGKCLVTLKASAYDSTAVCTCDEGWSGKDCSVHNCPNACGGPKQGSCNEVTGKCTCKAGFRGKDCTKIICKGDDGKNGGCFGRGNCDGKTGQCSCHRGYFGKACEFLQCPSPAQAMGHKFGLNKDSPFYRIFGGNGTFAAAILNGGAMGLAINASRSSVVAAEKAVVMKSGPSPVPSASASSAPSHHPPAPPPGTAGAQQRFRAEAGNGASAAAGGAEDLEIDEQGNGVDDRLYLQDQDQDQGSDEGEMRPFVVSSSSSSSFLELAAAHGYGDEEALYRRLVDFSASNPEHFAELVSSVSFSSSPSAPADTDADADANSSFLEVDEQSAHEHENEGEFAATGESEGESEAAGANAGWSALEEELTYTLAHDRAAAAADPTGANDGTAAPAKGARLPSYYGYGSLIRSGKKKRTLPYARPLSRVVADTVKLFNPQHSAMRVAASAKGIKPRELYVPCGGLEHGVCVSGSCYCGQDWTGSACHIKRCPNDCSGRGICLAGKCVCSVGWGPSPKSTAGNNDCSHRTVLHGHLVPAAVNATKAAEEAAAAAAAAVKALADAAGGAPAAPAAAAAAPAAPAKTKAKGAAAAPAKTTTKGKAAKPGQHRFQAAAAEADASAAVAAQAQADESLLLSSAIQGFESLAAPPLPMMFLELQRADDLARLEVEQEDWAGEQLLSAAMSSVEVDGLASSSSSSSSSFSLHPLDSLAHANGGHAPILMMVEVDEAAEDEAQAQAEEELDAEAEAAFLELDVDAEESRAEGQEGGDKARHNRALLDAGIDIDADADADVDADVEEEGERPSRSRGGRNGGRRPGQSQQQYQQQQQRRQQERQRRQQQQQKQAPPGSINAGSPSPRPPRRRSPSHTPTPSMSFGASHSPTHGRKKRSPTPSHSPSHGASPSVVASVVSSASPSPNLNLDKLIDEGLNPFKDNMDKRHTARIKRWNGRNGKGGKKKDAIAAALAIGGGGKNMTLAAARAAASALGISKEVLSRLSPAQQKQLVQQVAQQQQQQGIVTTTTGGRPGAGGARRIQFVPVLYVPGISPELLSFSASSSAADGSAPQAPVSAQAILPEAIDGVSSRVQARPPQPAQAQQPGQPGQAAAPRPRLRRDISMQVTVPLVSDALLSADSGNEAALQKASLAAAGEGFDVVCDPGWTGADCSVPVPVCNGIVGTVSKALAQALAKVGGTTSVAPAAAAGSAMPSLPTVDGCGLYGVCTFKGCACRPGWAGQGCEIRTPAFECPVAPHPAVLFNENGTLRSSNAALLTATAADKKNGLGLSSFAIPNGVGAGRPNTLSASEAQQKQAIAAAMAAGSPAPSPKANIDPSQEAEDSGDWSMVLEKQLTNAQMKAQRKAELLLQKQKIMNGGKAGGKPASLFLEVEAEVEAEAEMEVDEKGAPLGRLVPVPVEVKRTESSKRALLSRLAGYSSLVAQLETEEEFTSSSEDAADAHADSRFRQGSGASAESQAEASSMEKEKDEALVTELHDMTLEAIQAGNENANAFVEVEAGEGEGESEGSSSYVMSLALAREQQQQQQQHQQQRARSSSRDALPRFAAVQMQMEAGARAEDAPDPSPSPAPTPTNTPSTSFSSSSTSTNTPTNSATNTRSGSQTASASQTSTPSGTKTQTTTPSFTPSASATPSSTFLPAEMRPGYGTGMVCGGRGQCVPDWIGFLDYIEAAPGALDSLVAMLANDYDYPGPPSESPQPTPSTTATGTGSPNPTTVPGGPSVAPRSMTTTSSPSPGAPQPGAAAAAPARFRSLSLAAEDGDGGDAGSGAQQLPASLKQGNTILALSNEDRALLFRALKQRVREATHGRMKTAATTGNSKLGRNTRTSISTTVKTGYQPFDLAVEQLILDTIPALTNALQVASERSMGNGGGDPWLVRGTTPIMHLFEQAKLKGVCRCMEGFRGKACEERFVAKGHGTCDPSSGRCTCGLVSQLDNPLFVGQMWDGPACTLRTCRVGRPASKQVYRSKELPPRMQQPEDGFDKSPLAALLLPPAGTNNANKPTNLGEGTADGNGLVCSGNGLCDSASGRCACFAGWQGDDCSRPACVNECGYHGRCVLAPVAVTPPPDAAPAAAPAVAGATGAVNPLDAFKRLEGKFGGKSNHHLLARILGIPDPAPPSPSTVPAPSAGPAAPSPSKAAASPSGAAAVSGAPAATATAAAAATSNATAATTAPRYLPAKKPFILQAKCECDVGWTGANCNIRRCPGSPSPCNGHGRCVFETGECSCHKGYYGDDCSIAVGGPDGNAFIMDANDVKQAACGEKGCGGPNKGLCNAQKKECMCKNGYTGQNCEFKTCPQQCNGKGICDPDTGLCACQAPWSGASCSVYVAPTQSPGPSPSTTPLAPLPTSPVGPLVPSAAAVPTAVAAAQQQAVNAAVQSAAQAAAQAVQVAQQATGAAAGAPPAAPAAAAAPAPAAPAAPAAAAAPAAPAK